MKRQRFLPLATFKRITRSEAGFHRVVIILKLCFYIWLADSLQLVPLRFGFLIIANLEIGGFQEIKRVHFVMHHVQMHGAHVVCNTQRSFIGLNVILPEAQARKNV